MLTENIAMAFQIDLISLITQKKIKPLEGLIILSF